MKKRNTIKAISLLLCMVMIAVGCMFSLGVISFADDLLSGQNSGDTDNSHSVSQMKGDYVAPYSIENYGCADISVINTEKNLVNYSNVSIDKVGTEDSYALKIEGSNADYAYVKIGDTSNLLMPNKTYVITMQLKKSGTVNSFNSGIMMQSSTGLTEAYTVADADLKEDEWTEYTFEYKPTKRTGRSHLYLKWDIAENSALYIDNYTIVEKSDTSGYNLVPIGNFDRSIYVDGTIDNSPIENANYAENSPEIANNFEIVKGEGYQGSYGAKLTRTQSSIDSGALDTGYLQFADNGVFENNTQYIIEFKAKRVGITALNILFREKSQEHTAISLNSQALNDYMSDNDYVLYRITYETDGNASTGKSRISFSVNGTADSYILIDDINIYAAADTEKISLLENGDFDEMRIASNTEAEWTTVQIPYVLEEYDCIPNYGAEYHLPQNADASIDKVGVDDTYALKIVGDGANGNAYVKLGTAVNFLKGGTEYKISMKVKKSGTVNSFSAGISYSWNNFPHDFTANVGDEWQEISFNITPENNTDGNTGWNHLMLGWNIPVGSELYIDDITVVETNDESATNIYTKGAFDATAHEESVVNEAEIEGALYSPAALESEPVNSSIVENEGFKGSYALKMEGTGAQTTAQVRYDTRPGLQNYTEYYIEFKAKKYGNVSYFAAGIREQWENHEALSFGNAEVVEARISDSFYNYYRIKYTTDGNALGSDGKGAWTFVTFTYTADEGAYILIDDIKIYKTGEEEPYETFRKGTFDYTYYDLEFDNTVDGTAYIARTIDEYSGRHNFYVTGTQDEINSTISIAEGEGVKGSAALKIDGSGVTNSFKISMNSLSELVNNCDYKIGLKVKVKAEENVIPSSDTFFQYGLIERWTKHYTLNFKGEKFKECLTEDYHYYQFLYETDNNCDGAWSYLVFNYNMPVGMSLYIDEIELIPVSEEANWITDGNGESINLLRKSTFDMKDLGQDPANFSEERPMNVESVLSYQYTNLNPHVVTVSDAPSGGYCLALGFEDSESKGEYMQFITPAMPGESYKITFWVKVVGEVENAAFYMSDGKWLNHTYGVDFSQYETGKWTKFELIYNDKTTPYEAVTYRRLKFEFEAPAGSGMLIDNITCIRVDCDYESFDIYGGGLGDFERSELYPEIAWDENQRFIYKEGE